MIRIPVKALSVNECYRGRRFKTKEYEAYEKEVGYQLPGGLMFDAEKLKVVLEFGVSNKGSDLDNLNKCLVDIIASKYGFNDNRIYEIHSFKKIVDKGNEYIEINITPLYQ